MARLKRSSATLEKAIRRMAGMQSINSTLEFSDGLSLSGYHNQIKALQAQLLNYNTLLSTLDEMTAQVRLMEQELGTYSEKMLMSVATRYGKDSMEYMQAGGKPRKRMSRSTSTTQINSVPTTTPTSNGNGAVTNMN